MSGVADNEPVEVRLASAEGDTYTVNKGIIALSSVISGIMNDLHGEVDTNGAIPVPNVSSDTLLKVIQWCTHHKDNPPELIVEEGRDKEAKTYDIDMSDWDKEFFNIDLSAIYDLILSANFLYIKGLLYQGCKHIADNFIRGKTVAEVREKLGIENDFTPEELEQVIKWCTHHKDNPPELIVPDDEAKTYDIVMSEWDKEFFNLDLSATCDLIMAANYLDIKGLLYQCSKHFSDKFVCGKTAVEVRENMGLADDLTPEQREQLKQVNAWCEDEV